MTEQQKTTVPIRAARSIERIASQHLRVASQAGTVSFLHDLGNLVNIAYGHLQFLYQDLKDSKSGIHAEIAIDAMRSMEKSLRQYRCSSGPIVDSLPTRVDPDELIRATLDLVQLHDDVSSCEVIYHSEASEPCDLIELAVQNAVVNLILNAAQATGPEGKIEVKVAQTAHQLIVEVHDNGPGVDRPMREIIFRPFVTTKLNGSGMGLAAVQACAESHGGFAEADDSPLGGACFRLLLPIRNFSGA